VTPNERQHRDVVVFDGVCNLCSRSVRFIIAHEAVPHFEFAPVQSPAGQRLLKRFGFAPDDVKTFVLIAGGKAYVRSDAAIRIARHLRGAWKLTALVWILPRPLRDWLYDVIARNRYRWFGRTDVCMVPTPEVRSRFLFD
jgi:predicted DCC family thiol-disulfide oxidoreductase YuxK